jgi:hypothetical protein
MDTTSETLDIQEAFDEFNRLAEIAYQSFMDYNWLTSPVKKMRAHDKHITLCRIIHTLYHFIMMDDKFRGGPLEDFCYGELGIQRRI